MYKKRYNFFIVIIFIFFNYCNRNNTNKEEDYMDYYYNTYESCRESFLKNCAKLSDKFSNIEINNIKIPCKKNDNLFIDYCYIPSQKKFKNIILLSSGVHGIEGFVGNAIQNMFIVDILEKHIDFEQTGILILHSINPYGHKYNRRVTENNVDLNRNFDTNENIFSLNGSNYNKAYPKINDFLNPQKKYHTTIYKKIKYIFNTRSLIKKHTIGVLTQAVLQGQYEFSKGIFFGGQHFEIQKMKFEPLILNKIKDYQNILVIDLHTGYGKKGKLHFFYVVNIDNKKTKNGINILFKGYELVGGNAQNEQNNFYTVTGSFIEFVYKLCAKKQLCLPIAFEFGTLNSHKKFGKIKSLQIMIGENQNHHYGAMSSKNKQKIETQFKEMYFPSDKKWRNTVIKKSKDVFPVLIKRLENM